MKTSSLEILTLAEQAYEAIEELIVTLELKPGEMVAEQNVVQRVGIGRTPVREAFLKLSTEGLVESIPRKGMRITEIHIQEHLALLETRRALERVIISRAAKRSTAEQREEFKNLAEAILSAASQNDITKFIHADHEFDLNLADACSNRFASEACAPLRTHCRRFWFRYHRGEDLSESATLHANIMIAVSQGNDFLAERACDKLIDHLEKQARAALDK